MADSKQGNELRLRIFSSFFIVLIIIGGIYMGGYVWAGIASALCLESMREYYRMLSKNAKLSRGIGYICSLVVLFSSFEGLRPVTMAVTMSLSTFGIFLIEIMRRQMTGHSDAVRNVGGTLSGVLFIAVPWTCLILLRGMPIGVLMLVTLFACTWGCDVGAFIAGKRWGQSPSKKGRENWLCREVSPNKTWEGFIGGMVGSMLVNAALIYLLEQPPYPLFVIGVICGIAGQLGDLAESLVKRETGTKDAGSLIPGHGGAFDRFDSILLNALITYTIFGLVM